MQKLLVIDDDEDVSAMLFLLLRSKFEVAVITKSEDIFLKIRNYQPNIILLDVFLTGYDGRVICKQLKFHPSYKHIPVIMVSGHDEVLDSISKYGADDFILKPFEADQLVLKIERLLAENSCNDGHSNTS